MTDTDLKSLYDFSLIHCELMLHTGSGIELDKANAYRDILYKELLDRLDDTFIDIQHSELKKP